jgi:hypothetical protein
MADKKDFFSSHGKVSPNKINLDGLLEIMKNKGENPNKGASLWGFVQQQNQKANEARQQQKKADAQ